MTPTNFLFLTKEKYLIASKRVKKKEVLRAIKEIFIEVTNRESFILKYIFSFEERIIILSIIMVKYYNFSHINALTWRVL